MVPELVLAYWQVGLGSGPSVGSGVSWGDWGFKGSYGSWPAVCWGCVSTQLATWSGVSQDWAWLAGRWGQVPVLIS